MSSILDAIHEIEHRQGTPAVAVPATLPETKPVRLPVLGGALAIVLTALATLSAPLWRSGEPATPAAATPAVAAAPTLPEVPARPAVHAERAATERPRAVRKSAAATRRDVAVAETRQAAAEESRQGAAVDTRQAAAAPTRQAAAAPRAEARGGVHLESLRYSPSPSTRSAILVVGGTRHVLHEGESRGNVAVQLIMRDRVYVAEGGNVFALEAPQ